MFRAPNKFLLKTWTHEQLAVVQLFGTTSLNPDCDTANHPMKFINSTAHHHLVIVIAQHRAELPKLCYHREGSRFGF